MEISSAIRPVQQAAASEQAITSFQIGLQKKVEALQENIVATLLQGAGIGQNIDLKA